MPPSGPKNNSRTASVAHESGVGATSGEKKELPKGPRRSESVQGAVNDKVDTNGSTTSDRNVSKNEAAVDHQVMPLSQSPHLRPRDIQGPVGRS